MNLNYQWKLLVLSNNLFNISFPYLSYRKRFPYYNIEGDSERNTVVFKLNDETFSVEELIAQLIQKSREYAETSTG